MSFKYWTEEDDDTLRERWHDRTASVSDIATDMGRSKESVRTRAKRLGLKRDRAVAWSDVSPITGEGRKPSVKYLVVILVRGGVTRVLLQTWNYLRARNFIRENAPRGARIKRITTQ